MKTTQGPDEMFYLKTKREFQGLQGTAINDNYYTSSETTLSAVETSFVQNRDEISITPRWGVTSTVSVGLNDFIGHTYLSLKLPTDATGDYQFPIGWGLSAIESISYLFPSSNIGKISISRDEIYHLLVGQNQSYSDTTLMMMLAGQGIPFGTAITRENRTACVLLPFPWSSMNPMVKGLDLTLFSNAPVILTVRLAPAYQAYALRNGQPVIQPDQITVGYRQGHLSNQAYSLKTLLDINPMTAYSYPFIRTDNKSVINVPAAPVVQVPISGFLDADLLGIYVCVRQSSKLPGINSALLNPWELDHITDVRMEYKSQVMYRANDFDYRLFGCQSVGSTGYDLSDASLANTVSNFPVFMDFSMKRQAAFGFNYYNTARYGGQTFNLYFSPSITTGITYDVLITCMYNSVLEISKGVSSQYLL